MFDSFPGGSPKRLNRKDYHADFYRHYSSGIRTLNKLERGQHFQERGFASWEAFAAGEWDRALTLVEEKRPVYAEQFRKRTELGILERRLRVVEFPLTPYVQWELHVLRLRVELGDHIRVMDARQIADIERDRRVPEVVILGEDVMYEVVYDDDGNADGCNRFSDRALVTETIRGFDLLYARGEDFTTFFERDVRPLPAPGVPRP